MKKFLLGAILLFSIASIDASTGVGPQCKGTTKKGTQCKRSASAGSTYCWQHGGSKKK